MNNTQLCALLGNALENAYTACQTVSDKRFITVTLRADQAEQSILIENCFDGVIDKEGDDILSRKRDHAKGIGLESMQSICESTGSHMDIRYTENTFQALFLIPTLPKDTQQSSETA